MGDIEKKPREDEPEGLAARPLTVRTASSIAEVPAADWDDCARGDQDEPANPFISHAFLKALEDSRSAVRETGWLPRHLLLEDGDGTLLGVMPCYLKSHSQGEYVFDHGWADAYARAGGDYYPKLQASVPFTPVPGRRLLVRAGEGETERKALLLQAAVQVSDRLGVSGLHITFLTEPEWQLAGELGLLKRTDQQFHWQNEGYSSFEDFLGRLASRKRKAVRKERREALSGGIEEHPFLHFEVCYYQAIDFAIQHKLARVEAGAQGAHKLARGYLPSATYSAHYIADPALRRAVADYLKRERRAVARDIALLSEDSPFRNSD